jgi:hypothetical protein
MEFSKICGISIDTIFYLKISLSNEVMKNETIKRVIIYPIPTHQGFINIKFESSNKTKTIRLIDINGITLKEIKSNNLNETINIKGIKQGIYNIKITSPEIEFNQKIVID